VRPGLIVGVLALAAIAYISLNSLRTEGAGSRGVPVGERMPPFAAPLAPSDTDRVARVAADACRFRGPEILNSCELAERGPVVLAFMAEPIDGCVEQVDVLDAARVRHPELEFAVVAIKAGRDDLMELIAERGWDLPVGRDETGAVTNAYAVAVCPQITFARRGGEVALTTFGELDRARLDAAIEDAFG
jgi:hypothetical protein